jgi:hypothetical protein
MHAPLQGGALPFKLPCLPLQPRHPAFATTGLHPTNEAPPDISGPLFTGRTQQKAQDIHQAHNASDWLTGSR